MRLFSRKGREQVEKWYPREGYKREPPAWWTPELEQKWLDFTLRDSRMDKPRTAQVQVKNCQGTLTKLTIVTGTTESKLWNSLEDLEQCGHQLRTFYTRLKLKGKYLFKPVGRVCLSCERVEWYRPLRVPAGLVELEAEA